MPAPPLQSANDGTLLKRKTGTTGYAMANPLTNPPTTPNRKFHSVPRTFNGMSACVSAPLQVGVFMTVRGGSNPL